MRLTPSQGAILMMLGHDLPRFPKTVRERMLEARKLLSEWTGEDFGYDPKRWHEYLSSTDACGYCLRNWHLKVPELIAKAQANPEWQRIRSQLQSSSSKDD